MTETFIGPDGRCYQMGQGIVQAMDIAAHVHIQDLMPPGDGDMSDMAGGHTFSPLNTDKMTSSVIKWCHEDTKTSVTTYHA